MTDDIPKLRTRDYPRAENRRKLSPRERALIVLRQQGRCAGCGIKAKAWEFDHVSARWKGQVSQTDLNNWQAFASRKECDCHKNKTAEEAADRAKRDRLHGKTGQLKRRKARGGSSIQGRKEIASRGFQKVLRKRMSGKVERVGK